MNGLMTIPFCGNINMLWPWHIYFTAESPSRMLTCGHWELGQLQGCQADLHSCSQQKPSVFQHVAMWPRELDLFGSVWRFPEMRAPENHPNLPICQWENSWFEVGDLGNGTWHCPVMDLGLTILQPPVVTFKQVFWAFPSSPSLKKWEALQAQN